MILVNTDRTCKGGLLTLLANNLKELALVQIARLVKILFHFNFKTNIIYKTTLYRRKKKIFDPNRDLLLSVLELLIIDLPLLD